MLSWSKGSRGLFVPSRVIGIFTDTTISLESRLRQRPDHYTIRAGRNLPDKEFRYLRTVIVTAAVYRGFNSMLPLASDIFVPSRVIGIFTDTTISLSSWLRQRPDHYTIRAGRNLPDKEFRYLRTVIVTAAVYRGFKSMLPLASDISSYPSGTGQVSGCIRYL